jgi:ribosomal protein S5
VPFEQDFEHPAALGREIEPVARAMRLGGGHCLAFAILMVVGRESGRVHGGLLRSIVT